MIAIFEWGYAEPSACTWLIGATVVASSRFPPQLQPEDLARRIQDENRQVEAVHQLRLLAIYADRTHWQELVGGQSVASLMAVYGVRLTRLPISAGPALT
jgi:hypothetical protein